MPALWKKPASDCGKFTPLPPLIGSLREAAGNTRAPML
jgi:hypothetical protein